MIGLGLGAENRSRAFMSRSNSRTQRPRQAITVEHRKFPGAKAVGSFLPTVTGSAFRKFGFSTGYLITDWQAIVGPELARVTAPERLKWPRMPDRSADEDTRAPQRRGGATLVLRVDGSSALDVQYRSRQLIERINAFLGYPAIEEIRLVQAPVASAQQLRGATRRPAQPPTNLPLTKEVAGIADLRLRSALARLGGGIKIAG